LDYWSEDNEVSTFNNSLGILLKDEVIIALCIYKKKPALKLIIKRLEKGYLLINFKPWIEN